MREKFLNIVYLSALVEWVIFLPLAIPFVAEKGVFLLQKKHLEWGLSGQFPDFGPFHIMILNFLAVMILLWATTRLKIEDTRLGLYDAGARLIFSVFLVYFMGIWGLSKILSIFLINEMFWGILLFLHYSGLKKGDLPAIENRPVTL